MAKFVSSSPEQPGVLRPLERGSRTDWRDLLMAAGFGQSLQSHEERAVKTLDY